MKVTDIFLERGCRTPAQTARVLNVTRQAVCDYLSHKTHKNNTNKFKLLYRLAINGRAEILRYLMDDNNFDENHKHKQSMQNELKYQLTIPPAPEATYGNARLEERIKQLKVFETITFQHKKVICTAKKLQLDGYGDYLCGYIHTDKLTKAHFEDIIKHFPYEITYNENNMIGFDLAHSVDFEVNHNINAKHFIKVLQSLIHAYKMSKW